MLDLRIMPLNGWHGQPYYWHKVKINPKDLIRQATAAKMRGVSTQAIARLVQRGKLTKIEIDGYPFLFRSEVESFTPGARGRPKAKRKRKT
jgi:hypothetical protein